MEYIQVEPASADKARKLLMRLGLLDSSRDVIHSRSYVFFPTLSITHQKTIKLFDRMGARVIEKKDEQKTKKGGYEQELEKKIGKKEMEKLSRGYDRLGDIAIIDFDGKKDNARKIANILMQYNKSIKTVLAKEGAVSGKYRVRKVSYVAGKKNFIANYKENNCLFRFDVRKVYFSNRLSYERSRILDIVEDKENVMVMFSGVGPFAIEIAKKMKGTTVVGIELNPFGHKYMLENIKLNRTQNVEAVLGDVKRVAGNYKGYADRIIMPLPMSSMDFLDSAYKVAKNHATVHLYAFSGAKDPFKDVFDRVRVHSKKRGYSVKLIGKRVVRPYSSTESEIVLDYLMSK